jgi:hypothetical protein
MYHEFTIDGSPDETYIRFNFLTINERYAKEFENKKDYNNAINKIEVFEL